MPTVIFKCLFIVITTKKAVKLKKKNHHEAYNVRRNVLNKFLRPEDVRLSWPKHSVLNCSLYCICIRIKSVVFTVEPAFRCFSDIQRQWDLSFKNNGG